MSRYSHNLPQGKPTPYFLAIPVAMFLAVPAVFLLSSAKNWIGTADESGPSDDHSVVVDALQMIEEGRQTFRYDTFGDEAFSGESLRLHEAVAGQGNGGGVLSPEEKSDLVEYLKSL